MVIQHNLLAMYSRRQLGIVDSKKTKSSEKLSSGYRINRAADDAAGLAISEKMRRQIRGLQQASMNCQDAVSLVQVADGALNEIHDMLHRGTELSIKAANDTLTQEDREYIQLELNQLIDEIDSTKERATFNEIPVLKGGDGLGNYRVDYDAKVFYAGQPLPTFVQSDAVSKGYMSEVYESGGKKYPSGTVDFTGVTADNVGDLAGCSFNIDCSTCSHKYTFKFTEGSSNSTDQSGDHYIYSIGIDGVTNGNDLVNRIISAAGQQPGGHYTTLENNGGKLVMHENRDWPGERNLAYYQKASKVMPGEAYGLQDIEVSDTYDLLIQAGSEPDQTIPLRLACISSRLLDLDVVDVTRKGETTYSGGSYDESTGTSTSTGEVTGVVDGPGEAIRIFKGALEYVSKERSRMGAYQNRFEHAIKNLGNVVENTSNAESRIRDTDMAQEMVRFSAHNTISQAGQSILAQANQSKQGVLSLLG